MRSYRSLSVSTFVAISLVGLLASAAVAQHDGTSEAIDSPVKLEARPFEAGTSIACSLVLPGDAALFGTDRIQETNDFIANEIFSPFRVFRYDDQCMLVSSWSTQHPNASTVTGIAVSASGETYWNVDFGAGVISEFMLGTGMPTGRSIPLPVGFSVVGPIVVDDHQPGEILCLEEIVLDTVLCVDAAMDGAPRCAYTMGSPFGNGLSDAVFPDDCSGQTLLAAAGTFADGRVARVEQFDCTGADPACTERWDLTPTSSMFVNGIAEFASVTRGGRSLMVVDNASSVILRLDDPADIRSCQGSDPDMQILFVNGSAGDADFRVDVDITNALSVAVHRPPMGNGRFVHQMIAGVPRRATVEPLVDLGDACFSFRDGSALVVENNVGKAHVIGASNYFGVPTPDPAKAPTSLASFSQPVVDNANLSVGAVFTHQVVAKNAASSSTRRASLSNAVIMTMR